METVSQKIIRLERKREVLISFLQIMKVMSVREFELNFNQFGSMFNDRQKWDKCFSEQLDYSIDICISELEVSKNYLKPEHILLSILRKKNTANYILKQLNINVNELIVKLETSILRYDEEKPNYFYPFSKEFIDLFDSASLEAEKLSLKKFNRHSDCITTSDLLLALIKNKNSEAGQFLKKTGLSYVTIRNKIVDNQHPLGLRSFKKSEKSILAKIATIDRKLNIIKRV